MSGPGVEPTGGIHHGFTTLMDMAPTFYEIAETDYPAEYNGMPVYPLKGVSLLPLVGGEVDSVHGPDYVYDFEHEERAMIRKGTWKIVSTERPFSPNKFELYDLATDLAEQNNLRETRPEKFEEMMEEWTRFAAETRLQFPSPEATE